MKSKQLVNLSEIAHIKGRFNTSHECEACDKDYCGIEAAIVLLKNGEDRIICRDCVRKWIDMVISNHKPFDKSKV